MRILIIKPILPYPLDQGSRRITYQILEALHEEAELTLVTRLVSKDEERFIPNLAPFCSKIIAPLAPNRKSIFHRFAYKILYSLKALFLLKPLVVSYSCPGVIKKELRKLSKDIEFDIVHVENWFSWTLAREVRGKVKILLAHDIDYRVNEGRLSLLKMSPLRFAAKFKAWIEKRIELKALRDCDIALTLTEKDRVGLKECLGKEAYVLPFSGDQEYVGSVERRPERGSILFLGSFRADFNRDAATYMVREIFPLVKEKFSRARLYLVGSFPDRRIFSLSGDGVHVVGRVQDVREYFSRAEVLALPLRFGGGLRVRLLEAMSAGLPVVTTKIGRSGVPGEDGIHFLVRESPEEFASAIGLLLEDAVLREKLGKNARELVLDRYNKGEILKKIRTLYSIHIPSSFRGEVG